MLVIETWMFHISNLEGYVNGVVPSHHIFGKVIRVNNRAFVDVRRDYEDVNRHFITERM